MAALGCFRIASPVCMHERQLSDSCWPNPLGCVTGRPRAGEELSGRRSTKAPSLTESLGRAAAAAGGGGGHRRSTSITGSFKGSAGGGGGGGGGAAGLEGPFWYTARLDPERLHEFGGMRQVRCAALCHAMLRCVMLRSPCCAVLLCALLHWAALYCAATCFTPSGPTESCVDPKQSSAALTCSSQGLIP